MTRIESRTIALRARLLALLAILSLSFVTGQSVSAQGTTVPISAGLATGIAADLFPVTVKLNQANLFLTDPVALFLDNGRIAMQVRFQAYDHRPAQDIAISEMGRATFSGILGYDSGTRRILLTDPAIEALEFDQDNAVTQRLLSAMNTTWSAQVTNPIRAQIPPHPYLLPFANNIQNLSYNGKNIILTLSYE